MWIPGLFLGGIVFLVGLFVVTRLRLFGNFFRGAARLTGDPMADRYSDGNLQVFGFAGLGVGAAIVLLSIFGNAA